MATILPHTTRATGTVLTASIYNTDHQVHITNANSLNSELQGVSAVGSSTGIIASNGSGVISGRSISAGANIAVTNGDGLAGNPTIAMLNPVTTAINIFNTAGQTTSLLRARHTGNDIEFGHSNPAGFGSVLGHFFSNGRPALVFNGEMNAAANTIDTRGIRAAVFSSDNAGGWVWENVATASANNQTPTTRMSLSAGGQLLIGDGSAGAPSISNLDDPDTGIYWSLADALTITTAGGARASFTTSNFQINYPIASTSTVNVPNLILTGANGIINWADDTDTWIRRLSENIIQFVAGGVQRGQFDTGGFDVNGTITASVDVLATDDIMSGKTVINPATVGCSFDSLGQLQVTGNSATTGILNRLGSDGPVLTFRNDNTDAGFVNINGANTVEYLTTSDERNKEFIGKYDPKKAIEVIRADPVREFNWKIGAKQYAIGWGAQTSHKISQKLNAPMLANKGSGKPDAKNFRPWGIDLSWRTPYLWAAMSDVLDRLEKLER